MAENADAIWKSNVEYLNKAVTYLIDKKALQPNAWIEIEKLLPSKRPEQRAAKKNPLDHELYSLEAVVLFRYLILQQSTGKGGSLSVAALSKAFEDIQSNYFLLTDAYETSLISNINDTGSRNTACGYGDGVGITGQLLTIKKGEKKGESVLKITSDVSSSYDGCSDIDSQNISRYKPKGVLDILLDKEYLNGVDHFFTNLIWLVVSGDVGKKRIEDAFSKASTPGLIFSFKDCGAHEINSNCAPEDIAQRRLIENNKTLCAEMKKLS